MMRRLFWSCAALLAAGCDSAADPMKLRDRDEKVVVQGATIYAARCAACHGDKLQGQPNWQLRDAAGRLPAPPHDAKGHTWHHPDEVLFRITKYGVAKAANLPDYQSNMPAFEGVLSDAEIVAVLSYIKAQWPEKYRRAQEEVDASARKPK